MTGTLTTTCNNCAEKVSIDLPLERFESSFCPKCGHYLSIMSRFEREESGESVLLGHTFVHQPLFKGGDLELN